MVAALVLAGKVVLFVAAVVAGAWLRDWAYRRRYDGGVWDREVLRSPRRRPVWIRKGV